MLGFCMALTERPHHRIGPIYLNGHDTKDGYYVSQNSSLRKLFEPLNQMVAGTLHEKFPSLHPNHLTIVSLLGVVAGSWYVATQAEQPYTKTDRTIATTIPWIQVLDMYDGALARKIKEINPQWKNGSGGILDAVTDGFQELSLNLASAVLAHKRRDLISEFTAYATAVSNGVPRLLKAYAESHGKVVDEKGKGILGVFGTRPARAVENGIAFALPEAQKFIHWLTIAANAKTSFDRAKVIFSWNGNPYITPEEVENAKQRFQILSIQEAFAIGACIGTYWYLRGRKSTESNNC